MPGDHDIGYKQLFAHPELVRDLLSAFTCFECFRGLEVSAFERINASYVSEQYSERHGDMVWRVRIADHVIYVYLLLEFQAQAERWMALRMQVYVGLLYQDLVKRHELAAGQRLPPVLPIVLYNGQAPWNASGELRELVVPGPAELAPFQASQRYLLIEQRSLDPAALEISRSIMAGLFRLELERSSGALREVLASLNAWVCGPDQAALRRSISAWIAHLMVYDVDELTIGKIDSLLEEGPMGERVWDFNDLPTWEDTFLARGRQQGLAEGRAEGRAEARQLLRAVLKRQIVRRFGALAPAAEARIEAASEDELGRWSERIIDAGSVEAVFAG